MRVHVHVCRNSNEKGYSHFFYCNSLYKVPTIQYVIISRNRRVRTVYYDGADQGRALDQGTPSSARYGHATHTNRASEFVDAGLRGPIRLYAR